MLLRFKREVCRPHSKARQKQYVIASYILEDSESIEHL